MKVNCARACVSSSQTCFHFPESELFRHIIHIEKAVQLANGDTVEAFKNDERFKQAADFSRIVDWTSIVTCVQNFCTAVACLLPADELFLQIS